MQIFSSYLLQNRVPVIWYETGYLMEYKIVYQRNIKVYKGVSNQVQFEILNADQKRVDISDKTLKVYITTQEGKLVLERELDILNDGSSTALKGIAQVKFEEDDFLDYDPQQLNYALVHAQGREEFPVFVNTYHGATGTIELLSGIVPKPTETVESNRWLLISGVYEGEALEGGNGVGGSNSSLHTMALYTTAFTGTVTVKTTVANSVNQSTVWTTIDEFELTDQSGITNRNYQGLYSYFRVDYTETAGTVDKVLLRN